MPELVELVMRIELTTTCLGNGIGELALVLHFNTEQMSWDNWARFNLDKTGLLQNTYIGRMDNPSAFAGKVDWSNLTSIRLQVEPKHWQGYIKIGDLNQFQSKVIRPSSINNLNVTLGTVDSGYHDLSIESTSDLKLDAPSIKLSTLLPKTLYNVEPIIENIKEINPGHYQVEVETQMPFMLTFAESYHPLWKAIIDGREIPSMQTDSFINGFWMDRTGKYTVDITFTGQRYANVGYILTAAVISGLVLAPFATRRYRRKSLII